MNLLATIQAFEQIPRADAVAQFQLLQSVEQVLAAADQKAVNEVLSSMEEAFVPVVLGGTSPPVRRAVGGCFRIACGKGQGGTLFNVIGSLEGALKGKGKAADLPGTMSSLDVMGGLCQNFGKELGGYFADNIKTFVGHLKDTEPGARVGAVNSLSKLIEGAAELSMPADWSDLVKVLCKASSDRALDVRVGVARCMIALSHHKGMLAAAPSEADLLLKTAQQCLEAECNGQLDRPSVMGRTAFATAFGAMLAAIAEFDSGVQERTAASGAVAGEDRYAGEDDEPKSAKKKKKADKVTQERILVGGLQGGLTRLVRLFATPETSRLLRTALVHSFLVFLQCAANCKSGTWGDETLIALVPEIVLGILGGGTKLFTSVPEIVHARECVRYIIHRGVVPLCAAEHGLRTLAESLIDLARQPSANGTVIVVSLLEVSSLFNALGDSISDIIEDVIEIVLKSVGRAGSPVRGSASLALRAIVAQFPANVPSLITQALQTIKVSQAEMSVGSDVKRQMDIMHGNSMALAAVLAELPNCDAGIPTEFMDSLLDFATNLLTNKSSDDWDVTVAQRQAGWNIVAGITAGLAKYWFEAQLVPLIELWDEVLGETAVGALVNARSENEQLCQVEITTHALSALNSFLVRSSKGNLDCAPQIAQASAKFLNNVHGCMGSLMGGPATNQLKLKLLQCLSTLLPIVSQRGDTGVEIPYADVLALAIAQVGPGRHGTSVLRSMLNTEDMLLWGPQREDWFVPNDLDEFRLFAEDHMAVWGESLEDALKVASVPTSLLICDTAIKVAGSAISMAPELGEPYLEQILERIKEAKKKPVKKKEVHTGMKVAFDLSKNAVAIVLQCFRDCVSENRTIAHEALLTKSMDLLGFLLLEDNAVIRCAAAEAFGLLARTAVDQFRKTCVNFLVNCMRNPKREPQVRGSFAFALGCVCRYTGEMWHPYMIDIIGTLQSGNQLPMPAVRVWTLYASSLALSHAGSVAAEYLPSMFRQAQLIAHAAEDLRGEAKVSYLVPTYAAMARLLRSTAEVVASAEQDGMRGSVTDNLGNDEFMVIAAELVGQVTEVREYAGVEAEFVGMLGGVLCAPGALMDGVREELTELLPVKPLKYLRQRLTSLRENVRVAAAKALMAFAAGTQAGRDELLWDIDASMDLLLGLFRFLDAEAGASSKDTAEAVAAAEAVVHIILRIHAPENSYKLLSLLRQVTLGLKASPPEAAAVGPPRTSVGEDDDVAEQVEAPAVEGAQERHSIGAPRDPRRARLEGASLGRWRTKLVSIAGVQTILKELEDTPEHFDAKLAEESTREECIVIKLNDLIGIASSATSSKFSGVRLSGLHLMKDILLRFGGAEDPYMPGEMLLAQYNAQIGAALRGIFPADESSGRSVSPLALVEVVALIRQYLLLGIVPAADAVALRRLTGLLIGPLQADDVLAQLTGARNFDDVTECRLVVSLHGAVAELHLAYGTDEAHPIAASLVKSLPSSLVAWMNILRDFMQVAVYVDMSKGGTFFKQGAPREELVPVYEEHFSSALFAACSLVGGDSWKALPSPDEDIIFLLGMAVAYLRGRISSAPAPAHVAKLVGVLGDVLASGVIEQLGLPMEMISELVAAVHAAASATGNVAQESGFLSKLVGALPKALWANEADAGHAAELLQAIVTVGCETIVAPLHPPEGSGVPVLQPAAGAFSLFTALSMPGLLPAALYLKAAACVMAMLLRAIESDALVRFTHFPWSFSRLVSLRCDRLNIVCCQQDEVSSAAVADTTTKMLGAIVKSSAGDADAFGEGVALLRSVGVSAVQCAEAAAKGASGQDAAQLKRKVTSELETAVASLVHLLALAGVPSLGSAAAAAAAAATDVSVLLSAALGAALKQDSAAVRAPALAAMVKLGQGLLTAAGGSGRALFIGVLQACGGPVVDAVLHRSGATEAEVQHGVAFYLLACRAVQDPAHKATLCSAIVPALIVLIGRGDGGKQSTAVASLAGKLCLSLAKDANLAADFKAQVARLTPELRATLERGLRAAMTSGASPANTPRGRSGLTGSTGSKGGVTPRSVAKPKIALKMDF